MFYLYIFVTAFIIGYFLGFLHKTYLAIKRERIELQESLGKQAQFVEQPTPLEVVANDFLPKEERPQGAFITVNKVEQKIKEGATSLGDIIEED